MEVAELVRSGLVPGLGRELATAGLECRGLFDQRFAAGERVIQSDTMADGRKVHDAESVSWLPAAAWGPCKAKSIGRGAPWRPHGRLAAS